MILFQTYFRCDGVKHDCIDGTDEEGCDGLCNGFACNRDVCLPAAFRNDSQVDCPGIQQKDEASFTELNRLATVYKPDLQIGKYDCENDFEERCSYYHPHCFPRNESCIYNFNRFGKQICPNMEHLGACENVPCPDMFKCGPIHPYCLPKFRVCDGVQDCVDGSDEALCEATSCAGYLRCPSKEIENRLRGASQVAPTICVAPKNICDGVSQCLNDEDEEYCDISCPSGCQCVGYMVTSNRNYPFNVSHLSVKTRFLDMNGNNRMRLFPKMFQNLFYLGYLDMKNMNISQLPTKVFYKLENLVELHLQGNVLALIEKNTFIGLRSLSTLSLCGNPIKRLASGAFAGLNSMKKFALTNTLIRILPDNLFQDSYNIAQFNFSLNKQLHLVSDNTFQGFKNIETIDLRYEISNKDIKDDLRLDLSDKVFNNIKINYLYTNHYKICCLIKYKTLCLPDADIFSDCSDLLANNALRVAVWILGICALIGNIFVFTWRILSQEYNNPATFFVVNLSVADLFMGIYLIIIGSMDAKFRGRYIVFAAHWKNSLLCQIAGVLSGVSSHVGVTLLLLITIDRFIAIVHQFHCKRFTMCRAVAAVAVVWAFWITSASMPYILGGLKTARNVNSSNSVCLPYVLNKDSVSHGRLLVPPWILAAYNFCIFVSIVILYVRIFWHMCTSRKNTGRRLMVNDYLIARRLLLLISVNFISSTPVNVLAFLFAIGVPIDPQAATWVAIFVIPLNAALNPYLYTISTAKLFVAKKQKNRQKQQMLAIVNSALEYRKRVSDVSSIQ